MNFQLIPPASITINREARQRREFTTEDLEASIPKVGILNPLIVDHELNLVAGERRLSAALKLGLDLIPVRQLEELSPSERTLIELEENVRRKDISWQDKARAIERMWQLFSGTHDDATQEAFADHIGYTRPYVANELTLAKKLHAGDAIVIAAPTAAKALNSLARKQERENANALADVIDNIATGLTASAPSIKTIRAPADDILNTSFLDWAPQYDGQKFNFLHCDFPYGVDLQDSDQLQAGTSGRVEVYEDTLEVYFQLLKCLAENWSRLMSTSSHLIFWYSLKHQTDEGLDLTRKFFHDHLPQVSLDQFPLIWLKSDNKGIAPDVQRQPRRIYETALFGRTGDRLNAKLISNAYAAPKGTTVIHPSEKPVPVLRHFFGMICDQHTRMLDPTCGSGTSLRAAESLGASSVLGLEIDPGFCENARAKLKEDRGLRLIAGEKT